jgi:aldehyde dehydrogenase (NAD+)
MTSLIAEPEVDFLKRPLRLYIDGEFVSTAAELPVSNPATGQVLAQAPLATATEVDRAVTAARRAFAGWRFTPPVQRARLIWALADRIEACAEELATIEVLDNGKPIGEARAVDIALTIELMRYYAGWTTKISGSVPSNSIPGMLTMIRREPVGVVAAITPWNFPLLEVAYKLGPALAAGCTVVIKPSELAPLSTLRLMELVHETGFPAGVVNVLIGGPEVGGALVAHPQVDKVAFTGQTATGKAILHACADDLKRVTLELGGKSPNIVFADADLDAAVEGAILGLYLNQGQCCCAGSRLFVQEAIYEKMVDKLASRVKTRKLGDPFDPATEQGPQVDKAQFEKVLGYIDQGKAQGAKCVSGGERFGSRGYFIKPTVFSEVKDSMAIAKEEIFGPVMQVLRFKEIDEVIERANTTDYGLAAAVWTRDIKKAHAIADSVRAGTVWINCYDVFDAAAPFGGFKQSGIGRELGEYGLANYTEVKTVTIKL